MGLKTNETQINQGETMESYIRYKTFMQNPHGVRTEAKYSVSLADAKAKAQGILELYGKTGIVIEKVEKVDNGRTENVLQTIVYCEN
jgi:hypothetical protein